MTHTNIRRSTTTACALIACFAFGATAASKDTLTLTGQTDSNGFSPTIQGNEYHYYTTIPANTAAADTIPVQFQLSGSNFACPTAVTVTAVANGQIQSAISFDTASFTMCDGDDVTHYIYVNTSALGPGSYTVNINYSTPGNNSKVDTVHPIIHLHVTAAESAANPPRCFLTDSSGLKLADCGGAYVDTDGSFIIVTNGKKITATNPGQFYLNLVWTNNTGSDQTFTISSLTASNVAPQGANSVHVLTYNATQVTASFDDVNTSGVPCGQTGSSCKAPIVVRAGETLWLTWHVSYQWIGSTDLSGIGNACGIPSTRGTISMSAILVNSDSSVTLSCGSSANGYRIQ